MSLRAVEGERIYRALLLSYPRRWRESLKTEEMLGVMLDAADADNRARPKLNEALDLVRHGLHARLRAAVEHVGDDVRGRISQVALVTGGGLAITVLLLGEVGFPGRRQGLPYLDQSLARWGPGSQLLHPQFGPFQSLGMLVYLGWTAMLLASWLSTPYVLRWLAVFVAAVTATIPEWAAALHYQRPPASVLAGLALLAIPVMLTPNRPARSRQRPASTTGATAMAALVIGWYAIAIWRFPARDLATARACYYWCPSTSYLGGLTTPQAQDAGLLGELGHGGVSGISHYAPPVLLVAISAAALVWRWDRTWLAAVTAISLPWLVIAARVHYWPWNLAYGIRSGGFGPDRITIALTIGFWALCTALTTLNAKDKKSSRNGRANRTTSREPTEVLRTLGR